MILGAFDLMQKARSGRLRGLAISRREGFRNPGILLEVSPGVAICHQRARALSALGVRGRTPGTPGDGLCAHSPSGPHAESCSAGIRRAGDAPFDPDCPQSKASRASARAKDTRQLLSATGFDDWTDPLLFPIHARPGAPLSSGRAQIGGLQADLTRTRFPVCGSLHPSGAWAVVTTVALTEATGRATRHQRACPHPGPCFGQGRQRTDSVITITPQGWAVRSGIR